VFQTAFFHPDTDCYDGVDDHSGQCSFDSYQHSPLPTPGWISGIVLLLVLVQLVICIWIIWFMRGYRLFAAFAVALQYSFSLVCSFILLGLLENGP